MKLPQNKMMAVSGRSGLLAILFVAFAMAAFLAAYPALGEDEGNEDGTFAVMITDGDAEEEPAAEVIATPTIDATTQATTRYLPVVFEAHDKHAKDFGIHCTDCHHNAEAEADIKAGCSSCHDKKDAGMNLKDAMHASCQGCHVKFKKEHPQTTAPVKCLGCHTERK